MIIWVEEADAIDNRVLAKYYIETINYALIYEWYKNLPVRILIEILSGSAKNA